MIPEQRLSRAEQSGAEIRYLPPTPLESRGNTRLHATARRTVIVLI